MLNKEVYEIQQNSESISDYYTRIGSLWGEIDGIYVFPPITNMTSKISAFINALNV